MSPARRTPRRRPSSTGRRRGRRGARAFPPPASGARAAPPSARAQLRARELAKTEALHLPVDRARQVVDEAHDVRVLVAAESLLAQRAELVRELVVGRVAVAPDDVRGDPADLVDRHADDPDAV